MNLIASVLKRMRRCRVSPVLSVYIGEEGKKTPSVAILRSNLHSLVHMALSARDREAFKRDIERMDAFLRERIDTRNTRGIVFFSSGKNIWEALPLPFPVHPSCTLAAQPFLTPLESALQLHQGYLVLLVDREKARMFTVDMGQIAEHLDVFDCHVPQEVKAIKSDFNRDNIIFRHIEDHLHQHLVLVAQAVKGFAKGKTFRFILLGGHRETLPKVIHHLPPELQRLVLGTFDTELNIPRNDILLHCERIVRQMGEQSEMARLTNRLSGHTVYA